MHPRRRENERFPRPDDQNSHHDLAQWSSLPTIHETTIQGYPIGDPGCRRQYGIRCEQDAASISATKTSPQSAFCGDTWMSRQRPGTISPLTTPYGSNMGPTNLGSGTFHQDTFSGPTRTSLLSYWIFLSMCKRKLSYCAVSRSENDTPPSRSQCAHHSLGYTPLPSRRVGRDGGGLHATH